MFDHSRRSRQKIKFDVAAMSRLTRFAFYGLICLIVFITVLFFWYSRDLPTPARLSVGNLSQSTRILDRSGVVLYDIYGDQNRTYVELGNIAKPLQQATIATEDKDFYTNRGFSVSGYLRVFRDALLLRGVTGASTLTQQLVKNALLTNERSLPRKIKEFILAIQVDKRYSKDQVLELYLNVAPYGGSSVGVEAASELYFSKKAKDLDLVQSAILAGMPQLPSYYSPYGLHPKAYIDRTKSVLRRMREDKYITKVQEIDADQKLASVEFSPKAQAIKAPHFSLYVKKLLEDQFGEQMVASGGLQVTTTLDDALQEKSEKIVKDEVASDKSLKVGNGAALVIDPRSGEILTMVGSRDFFATESATVKGKSFQGQFNVVTQALRQPGSSIKPVMYATALEKGYTAATLIMDTPTAFPGGQDNKDYEPKNYDGKFHGPVQMRFALGNSLNLPAVKMLASIGLKSMLTTANTMGLSTLAPTDDNMKRFGLSVTLGGGEVHMIDLASSYAAFANTGYHVDPVAILKVTDRKGKVLYEHKDPTKKRVLSEEVAFIISHILLDNNARLLTFGANSYLNLGGRQVAVKTGTTDDKRDNWAIGWTPNLLVVSWVGNNDNSPMGNVASGVTGATPIWRNITLAALVDHKSSDFLVPKNVVAVEIDALGGGTPVDGGGKRTEYFIKGTEPSGPSPIYKSIKISKADNGKLASDSEIAHGEYDVKKFIVFEEKDPVSSDGKNRWQEGIDAWIKTTYASDHPEYYPPKDKSDRTVGDSSNSDQSPTSTPGPTQTPTPTPTPTP